MAATNKRGIFSLLDVRERQGAGVWAVRGDVFLSPSPFNAAHPFGYFGGGALNPGNAEKSTVDRIDYSNDTATAVAKGPLSISKWGIGATGNQSFGYFGGGGPSPVVSTVSRIDYSNDTATAVAKGPLSLARYNMGATSNSSFGYFGGGTIPAKSTVDRIDYSNDTATAVAKGPLSAARYQLSATSAGDHGFS